MCQARTWQVAAWPEKRYDVFYGSAGLDSKAMKSKRKPRNIEAPAGSPAVELEEKLALLRRVLDIERPANGWIRAIREALGMTNTQLADRLGMKPQSVVDIQSAEITETIKMQTLRKLAEALDCQLVYAVVPKKPLKEMRNERAERLAGEITKRLAEAAPSDSKGSKRELDRLIRSFIAKNPNVLWK